MKKFSVYNSLNEKYMIFISDRFSSLRTDMISEFYDLSKDDCRKLVYKYHGYIEINDSIYFAFNEDAQMFIDDILNPYEIAFNLNGRIK